ncbi:hypothetical protein [Actinobaculum suis]|uniref:hypothetical protein n=1 Tax=Actinobaculum suis TaxID=1657 RepID=UPI0008086D64|nr:hypothetical protein [Actinobaculum suis]OCA93138.1 hypothetical protein ACU21_01435 [Actinobaculum suis]OCA93220.1 hypothetical protein ACU20_02355 [Actinobaculum suis]
MQAKKPSEGSTGRRRHRPAIQLSTVDQARLARGEIASAEEALVQALQNPVTAVPPAGAATDAATPRAKSGAKQRPGRLTGKNTIIARNAEEQRLLDERPPHFGKI